MFKYSKNKLIFQPGIVCAFDPLNINKQDISGIIHVKLIKRVKWKPFGTSIWEVKDVNNPDNSSFLTPQYLLYPSNMTIIRIPEDVPVFNSIDIKVLTGLIETVENNHLMPTSVIDRCKALKDKIDLCIEIKEV